MPSLKTALWGLAFGLAAVALYDRGMVPGLDKNKPVKKLGE